MKHLTLAMVALFLFSCTVEELDCEGVSEELTLQGNWINYDDCCPLRAWKDCTGEVHIQGRVYGGLIRATDLIVNDLPLEYRPGADMTFPVSISAVGTDINVGGLLTSGGWIALYPNIVDGVIQEDLLVPDGSSADGLRWATINFKFIN